MAVHPWLIAQNRNVSQRQTFDFHMPASRTDERPARHQKIARLRFLDADRTDFIEASGEHLRESLRHVLHDEDGSRKVSWKLRQHVLQCLRSSSRNADGDDL